MPAEGSLASVTTVFAMVSFGTCLQCGRRHPSSDDLSDPPAQLDDETIRSVRSVLSDFIGITGQPVEKFAVDKERRGRVSKLFTRQKGLGP